MKMENVKGMVLHCFDDSIEFEIEEYDLDTKGEELFMISMGYSAEERANNCAIVYGRELLEYLQAHLTPLALDEGDSAHLPASS
jgi:hypothetical protein